MNLLRFYRALSLTTAMLLTPFAFAHGLIPEQASLEVEAVGVIKNGHIISRTPCHASLANCLVTLTILPASQGFVDIKNTSTAKPVEKLSIIGVIPGGITENNDNCEVLVPGAVCTITLSSGNVIVDPAVTLGITGLFAKNIVFFDLLQIPD